MPPGPSLSVGSNDRNVASACSLCNVSIDDELAAARQHSEILRMVDIDSKRFIVAVNIDNGSLIPGNNEIFCVAVPSVEFGVGSCLLFGTN